MVSINKILKDKNFLNKLSLVVFFSISWLSISSSFQNLLIFHVNEKITIIQLINFFRTVLNILIFPILLFQLAKVLIKKNILNSGPNLILFSSLIYFLCQGIGLFNTSNSIENLIYVLSAINLIIIMRLSVEFFKPNELIILIYITFFILFIVLLNTFLKDVINFIFNSVVGKKFYGSVNSIVGENFIRSSGASRISLILLIIYLTNLIKYINSSILKIIPLFVFSTIIFLYESRAGVGLLIIYIVATLFLLKEFNFERVSRELIFCIILPFLVSVNINYIHSPTSIALKKDIIEETKKNTLIIKDIIEETKKNTLIKDAKGKKVLIFLCNIYKCQDNSSRFMNKEKILTSSGRIEDWKTLVNKFDYQNKLFFGYGSQADRHLINQSASNGLIYSLVSSGLVGLSFFLYITVTACLYIIRFLLVNKNKNSIYSFAIFTLIIILIRSLIESSYAVFSVDFILFYMSLFLAQKYNKVLR